MKKQSGLLLILAVTLALTACGQSTVTGEESEDASVPTLMVTDAASALSMDSTEMTLEEEQDSLKILWKKDGKTTTFVTPTLNGLGPEESLTPEVLPFTSIMGHDGFVEVHQKAGTGWSERFYYAVDFPEEETPVCLGESCGYKTEDVLADLDGDGQQELICSSIYTEQDSRFAAVYRKAGGTIWKSTVDPSKMLREGDSPAMAVFLASENLSYYDREQGCFLFCYRDENGSWQEREAVWPEAFREEEYQPEERFFGLK